MGGGPRDDGKVVREGSVKERTEHCRCQKWKAEMGFGGLRSVQHMQYTIQTSALDALQYCTYSLFQAQLEQLRFHGFECKVTNEKLYIVIQLVKSDFDSGGECVRCDIGFAMTGR
jgi:hypothetical protein